MANENEELFLALSKDETDRFWTFNTGDLREREYIEPDSPGD